MATSGRCLRHYFAEDVVWTKGRERVVNVSSDTLTTELILVSFDTLSRQKKSKL